MSDVDEQMSQMFFFEEASPSDFCWTALSEDAVAPSKTHPTDAGWDLAITESVTIHPGDIHMMDTGIAVAIPVGYVGLIYPRSSIGVKFQVALANTVGVIDSDYRGPVKLALRTFGDEPVVLTAGQRVAQMVLTPCLLTTLKQVDELPDTERGSGGFGSTGT